MTPVWIVWESYGYDVPSIVEIYSSEEYAEAYIASREPKDYIEFTITEEWVTK